MNIRQQFRLRKHLIAKALSACAACSLAVGLVSFTTPASAQIAVFDPHNYSQNILTAARTLQQVNNQIQSLQNEATMLLNQAKNPRTGDALPACWSAVGRANRIGASPGAQLAAYGVRLPRADRMVVHKDLILAPWRG